MAIPRGSNLPHRLRVNKDLRTAVVLNLTYQQHGKTVLKKTIEDCTISEDEIVVEITQEESLKFRENLPTQIQARVKLADGSVFPSVIITVNTGELLEEGMIG